MPSLKFDERRTKMGLAIGHKDGYFSIIVCWVVLLLTGILAYYPGLSGPFILDDHTSIGALGHLGGVTDWETFKAFVFGGTAGPTGRPVAMLSFLIDGTGWPTDSLPFKRTNLIIHLLNGILLGVLISKVLRVLNVDRRDASWISFVSTACWLLHPFLVSTTLYAVQRMAQLSTMFVFAGLIGHLYGRSWLARKPQQAYLIMSLTMVLFTLLAVLSKENGILLPLLIGVIEFTIIASQRGRLPPLERIWAGVFIVMPSLIILTYLGFRAFTHEFFEIVPPRDFSIYERVLTEPRILADYLQHWFMPKLYTSGVFQDHFSKSTGMLAPITTLLSMLLHIAVISLAIAFRRKWPLFALAALFFYVSHLLESTVLNLDLYFEHRNYTAAAFLFLPLVAWLQKKTSRQFFTVTALAGMLVLTAFTRYSATVWQDFPSMVEASARKAPTSARAQAQHATILFNAGRYEESLQVINRAIQNIPGKTPLLLVNRLIILCNMGELNDADFRGVASDLAGSRYDVRSMKLYANLILSIADRRCPDVSVRALRTLFEGMLTVPHNADSQSREYSHIQYFVGLVETHLGAPSRAVAAFEKSLLAEPGADHAMTMARFLANNAYLDEALHLSELALLQPSAEQQGRSSVAPVTKTSIKAFQVLVRADIEAAGLADASPVPPER
jgi:protein O-mannosyl-transferase